MIIKAGRQWDTVVLDRFHNTVLVAQYDPEGYAFGVYKVVSPEGEDIKLNSGVYFTSLDVAQSYFKQEAEFFFEIKPNSFYV